MIDAVLTYHTNTQTCGTAKFNLRLARELGVQCYQVESPEARKAKHPLLSLRHHECSLWRIRTTWEAFDLFLHEYHDETAAWLASHHPMRIFAGNAEIHALMRPHRPDVILAWCPGTIDGNPERGAVDVLTFGMAHKIQTAYYAKLKTLLEETGRHYTISVSTAIHEGSPWDDTARVSESLRSVFGERLRVLGYLGDDALAGELAACSAVALFYDPALRANNTTFWAAMAAHKPIITNRDKYSPNVGVHDIATLRHWPELRRSWSALRYEWPHLKELLCAS